MRLKFRGLKKMKSYTELKQQRADKMSAHFINSALSVTNEINITTY